MFVPTSKKTPLIKNWKNGLSDPCFDFGGQTNIAMINGDIVCLDIDKPEMIQGINSSIPKLAELGPVVKTKRGWHFYFKNEYVKSLGISIKFLEFGETRTRWSYQLLPNSLFNIILDGQLEYSATNFSSYEEMISNIKEVPINTIEQILGIKLELKNTNTKEERGQYLTRGTLFIGNYLPTKPGQNNDLIGKLVRAIYKSNMWAKKEDIWKEWLSKNKFLKNGEDYTAKFNSYCKTLKPEKTSYISSHMDLFKKNMELTGEFKSKQKKINRAVELTFKELSKYGRFHFSTKLMERETLPLEERVPSSCFTRAIKILLKANKAQRVEEAWRWASHKKVMKSAVYTWNLESN